MISTLVEIAKALGLIALVLFLLILVSSLANGLFRSMFGDKYGKK